MKLNKILNIDMTLKAIIDNNTEMPAQTRFKFLTILKQIEPFVQNFELVKNIKINQYGTPDEDGNIKIDVDDSDTYTKFKNDIELLLNDDVDVEITKIKSDLIFSCGIKSDLLLNLYEIIEE